MTDKRPVDCLRDGAGSLEVKIPDDNSAITGMITFGDRLLSVKEKGIYEIKLADQIDPERKAYKCQILCKEFFHMVQMNLGLVQCC